MTFTEKLKMVFRAKKKWRFPDKSDVLLYDCHGSDLLFQYIDIDQSAIFYTRGEYINIPALLLSKFSIESYIDKYIELSNPKFVVTFIDNNISFYSLKIRHPRIIFIFIQNGVRGERGDVFSRIQDHKKQMFVDYMLTFNRGIGYKYLRYISGSSDSIGSLKNNYFSVNNTQQNKSVLFISQYTQPPSEGIDAHFQFAKKTSVSWSDVYEAEKKVLKYLSQYCKNHNLRLSIAGRLHSSKLEYEFYKTNIVNFDDWEFLPKINDRKSYNAVDESQYIIGIDSTLLYESFSRGKKTAFFTCRGEIFGENVGRFAWPNELRDTGPFWSNSINKNEFNRVMDYIINVHSDEWMRVCLQYNENVMDYDSGNKKLISLFKNIGLPINKKYV